MRKWITTLLIAAIASYAFGQETAEQRRCRRGQAPGYATRDATVLSMMGWGLGIAIGIAALCALIENNPASTSTSGGGSSSGGSTTH
ncbi:MAG: hypothetical protein K1X28_09700 [Parachlamydiales bacterium]|nr:hypothetical protein [Parachlamydiales bacterium]